MTDEKKDTADKTGGNSDKPASFLPEHVLRALRERQRQQTKEKK